MKRVILLFLSLNLLLTGCTTNPSQAVPTAASVMPTQTEVNPNSTSYPGPEANNQVVPNMTPDYPAPELQPTIPTQPIPSDLSPKEGKSSIKGRLVTQDGKAYINDLFLANFLKGSDPAAPELLTFSENSSPYATQDPVTGVFVFVDIEPGKYGLGISSPGGSMIVPDKSGNYLSFETKSNEVLDLGDVIVP